MRKNKTMRVAALLLALVLMTSCFVGGTFAKYVTSVEAKDQARVAYWGFTQKPVDIDLNLFHNKYGTTVASEDDNNVVAPGTSETATIDFEYTDYKYVTPKIATAPEVAYNFKIDVKTLGMEYSTADVAQLDANPNFTWTLMGPGIEGTKTYNTLDELVAGIKGISGDASGSKDYEPNTLPTGFKQGKNRITIGWNWAFETAGEGMAEQDAYDTMMGNSLRPNSTIQNLNDLQLVITITATQID